MWDFFDKWAFLCWNFGKNMKLSIFHEIWEIFKKCFQQKRIIFCFQMQVENWIRNFLLENRILRYVYFTKISTNEKIHLLQKFPYKIENNFHFKFYIWFWKICQNRLVSGWDITNLWFRDNVQNLKTLFVLKNMGQIKKCHLQNSFTF